MTPHQPTFIIADDHPLFRAALRETLRGLHENCRVVEAADIDALQLCVEQHPTADLILLDLHMPGAQGFSALIHLTAHHPGIPVIVVSALESPDIIARARDHGAAGFIPKSSSLESMRTGISAVLAGGEWLPPGFRAEGGADREELAVADRLGTLTPQQFRVATLLAQGLLNKQIAYQLAVTEATVKAHVSEILRKLGVHSRTQAVLAVSHLELAPSAAIGLEDQA